MNNKCFVLLLCFVFCTCFGVFCAEAGAKTKADKQTIEYRYEVENFAKKADKSYELRIWTYSKKAVVAMEQCKKNAVHTVVFKGIPASKDGRTPGIKALFADNISSDNQKIFFDAFFADGGDYMRFVTETSQGLNEVIKIGKEYKLGIRVIINVPALRQHLEKAGMIRALNFGF